MTAPACGFQVGATVDAAQGGEAGEAGVTIDAAIDTASTTCADAWYGAGWAKRIRVSRVARSAAFLATTFSNQNAPGMFAVIDAPETCP